MKLLKPKTVEYQVLDARQKAVKILTNAAYGYAGWVGARWYIKPVAEAASAWGRHINFDRFTDGSKKPESTLFTVTQTAYSSNTTQPKQTNYSKTSKQEFKLDVEIGEVYVRIFFTEAKKRYAGLRKMAAWILWA